MCMLISYVRFSYINYYMIWIRMRLKLYICVWSCAPTYEIVIHVQLILNFSSEGKMKSKYSLFLCLLLLSFLVISCTIQIHTTEDEKQVSEKNVAHIDNDGSYEDRKYETELPGSGWTGGSGLWRKSRKRRGGGGN
ncbi:hypothetical protein IC582_025744 [Cucumis melo]